MKFMRTISLGLALLVSATANSSGTVDCATDLATLRVLTDLGGTTGQNLGFQPWQSIVNGDVVGTTVGIACELRKRLGYNDLVFVNDVAENLIADLQAGKGTIVISHVSIPNPSTQTPLAYIQYNNDADESIVSFGPPFFTFNSLCSGTNFPPAINIGVVSGQREESILMSCPNLKNITITPFPTLRMPLLRSQLHLSLLMVF